MPQGLRNTKGNGSSDLRCVVFLGSPYGANPSTARLWESAPKGARTGCPRLIFEAGCLVRSARAPQPEERRVGLRHPGGHSLWLLSLGQARESSPGWPLLRIHAPAALVHTCTAREIMEHPAFKCTRPQAARLRAARPERDVQQPTADRTKKRRPEDAVPPRISLPIYHFRAGFTPSSFSLPDRGSGA